ncbi:MAG TPA: hypothetical protein VJS64_04460 [Pyrinomonadaceae bacterium]|nr:hypothetical protein [Pyrinomonadaceae bacterium]
MSLTNLNEADRDVVRQCLHATVEGPFFPEWEFYTLFGLDRNEVRKVLYAWQNLDESNESVNLAINNSFANLLGYSHGCESHWSQFISASRTDVSRIFNLWRGDV